MTVRQCVDSLLLRRGDCPELRKHSFCAGETVPNSGKPPSARGKLSRTPKTLLLRGGDCPKLRKPSFCTGETVPNSGNTPSARGRLSRTPETLLLHGGNCPELRKPSFCAGGDCPELRKPSFCVEETVPNSGNPPSAWGKLSRTPETLLLRGGDCPELWGIAACEALPFYSISDGVKQSCHSPTPVVA